MVGVRVLALREGSVFTTKPLIQWKLEALTTSVKTRLKQSLISILYQYQEFVDIYLDTTYTPLCLMLRNKQFNPCIYNRWGTVMNSYWVSILRKNCFVVRFFNVCLIFLVFMTVLYTDN
jgi:hypothetical protein